MFGLKTKKKRRKKIKSYNVIIGKCDAADPKSSWESFMVQTSFIVFEKRTQWYKNQLQNSHNCVIHETPS